MPAGNVIKISSPATQEYWEVPVLFEDDTLLALDKPACILCTPDRYDPNRPNIMRWLHKDIERGAAWVKERGITYLANVHRLDFETSGVFLLVKTKPALVTLTNAFGSEKPDKRYVALVHDTPQDYTVRVDAPIGPHPARPELNRVDRVEGKHAVTEFRTLETFSAWTLVEARPLTGRTHQIRVHLRHLGLPVVGDAMYGGRPLLLSRMKKSYRLKPDAIEKPLIGRTALHARSLEIAHPVSGEKVRIEAPLPRDFEVGLKYLRRYAPQPDILELMLAAVSAPGDKNDKAGGDDDSKQEQADS